MRINPSIRVLIVAAALLVAATGCDNIGVAPGGARPAGWKPGPGRPPSVSGAGQAAGTPPPASKVAASQGAD